MLVYLDTWLWSRLSQARDRDPGAFQAFRKVWRASNCELCVSRAHLYELRRHKDAEVRAARYQLVEELLPGRLDMLSDDQPLMNSVTNREIALAFAVGFRVSLPQAIDQYWAGFPVTIRDKDDVSVLRQI